MTQVIFKITGTQKTLDGEENTIELITEGKYYEKNDSIFLVYDESEISGMEGSTTTLKIEDEKVTMKRFGSSESKLIFEQGVRHESLYVTAYGVMDMEVVANKIDIQRDADMLKKLNLSYSLNVSQNTEIKNKLSIDVLPSTDL